MASSLRTLKITAVGDSGVGKTGLLFTFTQNEFPVQYMPIVFEDLHTNTHVDGKDFILMLWDTAGSEDYVKKRLRPLIYPNTDCFLLCYSISNRASFENVNPKWFSEIRDVSPHAPIVLVGTKSDLRVPKSKKYISLMEAKELKSKLKASFLVECSALKKQNLVEVFEAAVRAVEKSVRPKKNQCEIL